VEHVLDQVDLVLLMSVNPGFGGQSFIPFVLQKIEELAQRLQQTEPRPELEVDGGIKIENCRAVADAGATILVAGSAIFGAPDPRAAIGKMRGQVA
jgi:ribulose-phosphate 3-epimerase